MSLHSSHRIRVATVLLAGLGLAACDGGDGIVPPDERIPATVVPQTAPALSAPVGTEITPPPSVLVEDAEGLPVASAEVAFSVTAGGGSVTGAVATTGEDGIAEVGSWTLGPMPGINELTAVVEGVAPVTIQAVAQIGAPVAVEIVTEVPSEGAIGSDVTPTPEARVLDGFGNPVPGVTVRFDVIQGGGSVAPREVLTGSDGIASPARWTLGVNAGPNILRASVTGVAAALVEVEGVDGTPVRMVAVQGDNQQGAPGESLSLPPAVRIEDNGGNPVDGVEVTFAIVAGGGSVSPGTVTTGDQGVAAAGSWILGPAPGQNTVEASAEGLDPVTFDAVAFEGGARDMSILEGDGQTAEVGRTVAVDPAVRLVDSEGTPVAGQAIDFVVEAGNGSVTATQVETGADGVARTGWRMGPDPGFQSLRASMAGIEEVVFTATAEVGPPAVVRPVTGASQTAVAGGEVPVDPRVQVVDRFGNVVEGATVTFQVTAGGGTVTGAVAVTDDAGIARLESWTLGATPGQNTLEATAGEATPATFVATAVAAGGYGMEIRFIGTATTAQRRAVERARVRWNEIVEGDVPPVTVQREAGTCGIDDVPALNETIDDLVIFVRFDSIDGPRGVLGSAGPCLVRSISRIPVVGIINLDSDDLEELERVGLLETVILHEMGHVLGIGTLWPSLDLLVDEGGADPIFVGEAALDAWEEIDGPGAYGGRPVPVANTGGPGTRDSHWREDVLRDELMTGFVGDPPNPLSRLTVASLADLGYAVDLGEADSFVVPPSAAPAALRRELLELREVPLPPPRVVEPGGGG